MQGKKITKKQWDEFLEELKEMIGLISATCEKLNISRASYYNRRDVDKEFAKAADKIMDRIGTPFTEDKLREAIFKGEGWAIKFYLQCKSKKWRPYERREFPEGLRLEVEQKLTVDPLLRKKAIEYEQELKKQELGTRANRRKPAGVGKKRTTKKRKR